MVTAKQRASIDKWKQSNKALIAPRPEQPRESWWVGASAERFTQRAEASIARDTTSYRKGEQV